MSVARPGTESPTRRRRHELQRRTVAPATRDLSSVDIGNGSLLGIAAKLFRGAGYGGATTRQLARELGVRSPSLYYHIGSKEDLLYAICVDSLRRITDAVVVAVGRHAAPADRIRALIGAHVCTALGDADKHITMLVELRSLSRRRRLAVVELRDAYERLLRREIRSAQRARVVRTDIAPKYLALALLNLMNWTIFWYRPGAGLGPTSFADVIARLFFEGAQTSAGVLVG